MLQSILNAAEMQLNVWHTVGAFKMQVLAHGLHFDDSLFGKATHKLTVC